MTSPVVTRVSQATLLSGSSAIAASRMVSEIWSAILSGCPSVTDSEVNRCEDLSFWSSAAFQVVVPAVLSEIGRASCRERGVDLGGRRIIKKKKREVCSVKVIVM